MLATAGFGTALGVIRQAYQDGARFMVYVDETRPYLQGARLTAWELTREHIPVTLLIDSAAATLMAQGRIQAVIVGADRIAANGDVANKIGTYGLAVLAREHGIPFYVVAPTSSLDPDVPDGRSIPIEMRDPAEVTHLGGQRVAAPGVQVFNPAFDVTPADRVTAIVTEVGVLKPPYPDVVARAHEAGRAWLSRGVVE
jgi:methylthioribose-1-phosphate isomerase